MANPPQGPADLVDLFSTLNDRFFSGRLTARLEWSNRMCTIAGNCNWRHGIIRISRSYHAHYPEQLEGTLLHEMLHLALQRGHDDVFSRAATQVGAPLKAPGRAEHRPYKYVYACPSCGMRIKRRRKGVWACAVCSGGHYSSRYRLRIVEYL